MWQLPKLSANYQATTRWEKILNIWCLNCGRKVEDAPFSFSAWNGKVAGFHSFIICYVLQGKDVLGRSPAFLIIMIMFCRVHKVRIEWFWFDTKIKITIHVASGRAFPRLSSISPCIFLIIVSCSCVLSEWWGHFPGISSLITRNRSPLRRSWSF